MSFREFVRQYRSLAKKGWRRKNCDTQICLKRPGVKRNARTNFSFSPLSAVYFELTGRRTAFGENGTHSRKMKMNWETVCTIYNVSAYPNRDHPICNWKWGLKERLMKMIPVAK